MEVAASPPSSRYHGRFTTYVFLTCLVAGSGGLMYGYDLVIAGGIAIMPDFLKKFYPSVYRQEQDAKPDNYCKYNNQVFQLFSSSLYLGGMLGTLVASHVTKRFGRKVSMLVAGILFDLGTVLGTGAQNLAMLLSGRILLGVGIGFANQCLPLYLTEITPPRLRGRLGMIFGVYIAAGIFSGNVVNYLAAKIAVWGWRLSLCFTGIPAITLTLAGLFLVESPLSLIERGHMEQAKSVLCKIRGTDDVEDELEDLKESSRRASEVKNPLGNLLKKSNLPQLVMVCAIPFFQQVAGNDAVLFYGGFLFRAAGFAVNTALYSAVITGAAVVCSSLLTLSLVDRTGRRAMLLVSSVFMFAALVAIAIVLRLGLRSSRGALSRGDGVVEVVMLCVFVSAFGASWGPLTWLIPSELLAPEVRSVGQSVMVFVNLLFKFVIAQEFLSMFCVFKWGTYLFFAGWVLVMFVFALLLLPETKGVPIANIRSMWKSHWFWKMFVGSETIEPSKEFRNGDSKPHVLTDF